MAGAALVSNPHVRHTTWPRRDFAGIAAVPVRHSRANFRIPSSRPNLTWLRIFDRLEHTFDKTFVQSGSLTRGQDKLFIVQRKPSDPAQGLSKTDLAEQR